MEDLYPAVKLEGKNKKMKPDLIFEREGMIMCWNSRCSGMETK